MSASALLPTSFRARFLLVVFLAAVVPLGLIGAWITRSVDRAGRDLLRSELDQSIERIAGPVPARWDHRMSELLLLANNEVAPRALSGVRPGLSSTDSAYLADLARTMAGTIVSFEYRDPSGRIGWSSPLPRADTVSRQGQPVSAARLPSMTVRLPIPSSSGAPQGELVAQVSLAALVPIDTALRLPNGAMLQVTQRATGAALLPAAASDSDLLSVHRSLPQPELDLTLAAPLAAYIQPFERAARTGAITVLIVSLLALGLSAFLTTRLTASLQRLAAGADAVAGGDLEHRVEGRGPDEVRRVALAFNSMMENLRRTLGELSQRQALAAIGEYAATLSHEVRNGLTAIRVDLQRAEEKNGSEQAVRPLVARALDNVKRLDGIVTRSLHLSRSGRAPRRRLDLGTVLARAAQGAEASFRDRSGVLDRSGGNGAPCWVLGDAVALEQLFLNLLLNAAQSLRPGGSARLVLEPDGGEASIVVTDTGAGIPPEDLARFRMRADASGLIDVTPRPLPVGRRVRITTGPLAGLVGLIENRSL